MSRLQVKHITVRSLSVDFNEISWEIVPTSEDVLDFTFQILRSEAAMGPWEEISTEFEDRYFFIDNRLKIHNRYRQFHYLIRVRHKPTDKTEDFGPAQREAEPDLIATEVRRHINLLMHEFVGRRCWLLPKRTFGQRCGSCFNDTLKARVKSGCRTCFDTGFVRGYHSPIEIWIQFDPSPADEQQTNIGQLQQNNTTARVGYFPPFKVKDVIIEPENHRWRVSQVNSTQRLRAVVHQEVQLHEIPASDSEYLVDINFGTGVVKTAFGEEVKPITLRDLFLSGARNFTNPHTLENFQDEEIPAIYSLYGPTVK